MPQLCIPRDLDFETVQVLEFLARILSERRTTGTRLNDFNPNEIAAAASRTIGQVEGCDLYAWRGTENAAFRHLIDLAATALETADLIARAAELRCGPTLAAELRAAPMRPGHAETLAATVFSVEEITLPCDCEMAATR